MRLTLWIPLSVCSLLAGCADAPEPPRPNVLILTIDSLRADHLGCYGYERETSPNLDALAAESVLFERAYAHAPFTAPSHASLLTSLHIKSHGVQAWAESLTPGAHNLAERLGPAGYRTGAFHNHPGLRTSQLTRSFDEVQERAFEEAPKTVAAVLDWVDGSTQPFAAWVHLWDVHRPYGFRDWQPEHFAERVERPADEMTLAFAEERFGAAPPGFGVQLGRSESTYNLNPVRRSALAQKWGPNHEAANLDYLANRYDGGVWYADRGLGLLVDGLRARGLLENTILVITADHGEALAERTPCYFTHDPFLFEETLHVPLVVRLPGGAHAGARVDSLVRHVDVVPTIHELLDLPLLGDEQGASLVPLLEGGPPGLQLLLAETRTKSAKESGARIAPGEAGWLEERVALFDGHFKAIHDRSAGTWSLYDLDQDPGERVDLAVDPAHSARLASLQEAMRIYEATLPAAGDTSAELTGDLQQLLSDIGYLDAK